MPGDERRMSFYSEYVFECVAEAFLCVGGNGCPRYRANKEKFLIFEKIIQGGSLW